MRDVLLVRKTELRKRRTVALVAKLGNRLRTLGPWHAKSGCQENAPEVKEASAGFASIAGFHNAFSAKQKIDQSLLCRTTRSWKVSIIASLIAIHRAVIVANYAKTQAASIASKLTPATIAEGT